MGVQIMGKDDTPMSNEFLEFRFNKIDSALQELKELAQGSRSDFNNHVNEDNIRAEHVKLLLEEKQSTAGLWAGIGGAASGIGAFLYALMNGGK